MQAKIIEHPYQKLPPEWNASIIPNPGIDFGHPKNQTGPGWN